MSPFNPKTAIFRNGRFIDIENNLVATEKKDVNLSHTEIDILACDTGSPSVTAEVMKQNLGRNIKPGNIRFRMYVIKKKLDEG